MVWLSPLHRRRSQCIICRPLCYLPPPRRCSFWVLFPSVQGGIFCVVAIFRTILSLLLAVGGSLYRFWSNFSQILSACWALLPLPSTLPSLVWLQCWVSVSWHNKMGDRTTSNMTGTLCFSRVMYTPCQNIWWSLHRKVKMLTWSKLWIFQKVKMGEGVLIHFNSLQAGQW